jgi:hypothetical protein
MTTSADLEAAIDVVDDIARDSEQLSVEDAVNALDALERLAAAIREAMSLVETQAVQQLEQPKVVNGRRYVRHDEYKRRFNHDRIAKMVADRAIADRNGELLSTKDAVRNAANLMRKIYVSDSSTAKVGMIRHYLGVGDVTEENLAHDEWARATVRVYSLEEEE